MRYVITRLFKQCPITKETEHATVRIRNDQQAREIRGNVGTVKHDGTHFTELRGTGKLCVEMEPGTTFAIQPAE